MQQAIIQNPGFLSQLKLFEEMNTLVKKDPSFKLKLSIVKRITEAQWEKCFNNENF